MPTPSALSQFKAALVAGARFTVRFEPTVIVGNCGNTPVPAKEDFRTVDRVTSQRVYFKTPEGRETTFDFPPASELTRDGEAFVLVNPYAAGRHILSYTPLAA